MALCWNPVPVPVFHPTTGERAAGAKAYFYQGGTTTPLTVYTTDASTTPHANPVVANAAGVFPKVFIPYGDYGVRVDTADGQIIDPYVATIKNPAPPDDGGGGGIVVTTDQIFQTGFPLFLEQSGTLDGFVRDNGRTIGSASSGATERANADCAALYAFYWNKFPDSICPVSGGRGASAAADFAANRPIATLDKRGRVAVGLDDMGNSAANRIQVSTTISTTNASPTATVASASGLANGMIIISANVPAGTTITNIVGTTLTMSANATATASGTAARFSFFTDAQTPGSSGGTPTAALSVSEMPAHDHGGTTGTAGSHSHNYTSPFGSGAGAIGSAITGLGTQTSSTGSAGDHSHTISAQGGGLPHSNLQPGVLGTWYRKL